MMAVSPTTEIETARLRLRPFTSDDIDDAHRLWIDPGVRKFLWDDEVISGERAASVIAGSIELFETSGAGLWAMYPREKDTLIGFCGYWYFHDPPELQILYGLAPAYWGQGLATEATRAMIRYGFEELGFDHVVGSTDAPNTASARVMEKAGMTFEKQVSIHGRETVYYTISREAFRSGR